MSKTVCARAMPPQHKGDQIQTVHILEFLSPNPLAPTHLGLNRKSKEMHMAHMNALRPCYSQYNALPQMHMQAYSGCILHIACNHV